MEGDEHNEISADVSDVSTPDVSDVSDSSELTDANEQANSPDIVVAKLGDDDVPDKKNVAEAASVLAEPASEAKHIADKNADVETKRVANKNATTCQDDPYVNVVLPEKNEKASNNVTTVYGEMNEIGQLSTEIAYSVNIVAMKRLGPPLRPRVTLSCYTNRGKKATRHCIYYGALRILVPKASWFLVVWNQVTGPQTILIASVESVLPSWCSPAIWDDSVAPQCAMLVESMETKYAPPDSSPVLRSASGSRARRNTKLRANPPATTVTPAAKKAKTAKKKPVSPPADSSSDRDDEELEDGEEKASIHPPKKKLNVLGGRVGDKKPFMLSASPSLPSLGLGLAERAEPSSHEIRAAYQYEKSRADFLQRKVQQLMAKEQLQAQFLEDSRLLSSQRSSLSALATAFTASDLPMPYHF